MPTYSTELISKPERLAYWSEVVCKTYLVVGCSPLTPEGIDGHLRVRQIGYLEVSDVVSPAMSYRRREADLMSHEEHYQLVLLTHGSGSVHQDGREAMLSPGDITLYRASSPSVVSYPSGSRTIVLKIPQAIIRSRVPKADSLTATTLPASAPLSGLVASLMRESLGFELPSHELESKLAGGLVDIIAIGLESAMGQIEPCKSCRQNHLAEVKRYIASKLGDQDLHVETIAASNNISVRTLNRVFAAEGTTAVRWLWEQRLLTAYRLLSERRVRQVGEAAFDCGFNDLSHFSKAFKKRFGVSPVEILNTVRRIY